MTNKLEVFCNQAIGRVRETHLHPRQRIVNLNRLHEDNGALFNTVEEIVTNEIGWKLLPALAQFQPSLPEPPETRTVGTYKEGTGER